MNIKKVLFLCTLMVGAHGGGMAQELDKPQKQQPFFGGEKWKVKDVMMKTETLEKDKTLNKKIKEELDVLTQQQRFMELDDKLNLQPPTPELFNWLKARANEGNVPIMWMLASRYASINSVEDSVNWTYAALLGTMQERTLCLDTATDRALQEYMGRFSRPVLLAKSNGILLDGAKSFAIQKLTSIQKYPKLYR